MSDRMPKGKDHQKLYKERITNFRVSAQTIEAPRVNGRNTTGEGFDELVVGNWFHMEQMQDHVWWFRIGQDDFFVTIDKSGANVTVNEPTIVAKWRDKIAAPQREPDGAEEAE